MGLKELKSTYKPKTGGLRQATEEDLKRYPALAPQKYEPVVTPKQSANALPSVSPADRMAAAVKSAFANQGTETMSDFIRGYNSEETNPFFISQNTDGVVSVRPKTDYEALIEQAEQEEPVAWDAIAKATTKEEKTAAQNKVFEAKRLKEEQASVANQYYQLENELQRYNLLRDADAGKIYKNAADEKDDIQKLSTVVAGWGNMDDTTRGVMQEMMEKYSLTEADFYNAASGVPNNKVTELIGRLSAGMEQKDRELGQSGYDFKRMEQYQDTLERAEEYEKRMADWERKAEEHPVLSSIASVVAAPLQGVDFIRQAASSIGNNPEDLQNYVAPDVYSMHFTNFVNQIRGTVSKEIEENVKWGNVVSFLYQTGMSIADSMSQVYTLGPASLAFMGGAAASSTASDIIQRGGTSSQAFWGGLAAGAAEVIFEKVSIDNLLTARTTRNVRDILKGAAKQAGVEASEEMLTEISNIISDSIIMGENSNYEQAVSAYEEQGMSREDAEKKALLDSIGQVALAGLGGALSGGVSGGTFRTAEMMQYRGSEVGKAESTISSINKKLQKAGVQDPTEFYESVGVENPYLEAMTPDGAEFLNGAAEAYANLKNAAAERAQTRQQESYTAEQEAEAPTESLLDRAVAEVRETGSLSNRTATEILNTPDVVQTLTDNGMMLTSGMTQSQRRAEVKAAVEREAVPDTVKQAMEDVGLIWAGNQQTAEKTQPEPETARDIVYDGVNWAGNKPVTMGQAAQATEKADTITEQAQPITEQQKSQTVTRVQQPEGNNAIDGLRWEGSQQYTEAEQQPAERYIGNEPGTAQVQAKQAGNERMTANEGTEVSGGTTGQQLSQRTGEQTGSRVEYDAGRIGPATEQSRAAAYRQTQGKTLALEKISSKSLGLEKGTERSAVQILQESDWDAALQETAKRVRQETGKDIVFVLGNMEVEAGGGTGRIRGVYLQDRIIVQADNTRLTPEQIARHEEWHDITNRTPNLTREVHEKIVDRYGEEELDAMIQSYVKRMRKLLDLKDDASDEDIQRALQMAEEEIYADAYAGINAFGTKASQYQETVQEFASRENQQGQEQRQQEAERETGPPEDRVERYSMEDEELDLDQLYEQEERERQARIDHINKRLEKLSALDYQEQRFRESGVEALAEDDREVRKLQKEKARLEGMAEVQNKRTGEKKTVAVQPTLAKMEFRDNMLNLFSIPQEERGKIGTVLDNFADHVARYGKIDDRARDALFDRLYDEGVMQVSADEYLAMGREAVAGGRVYVPQQVKEEFGDDWTEFRRRLFANKIYAVDDPTAAGIDTWSAELAEVLPGLFDTNVYDQRQALERILQVAEEGRDQNLSLAEYTAQIAGETGVDVDTVLIDLERQMDYQIQKFASMANLETELRSRPELLRAEANERVQAIREQRDRTVQKVIDHYNDILERRTAEMDKAVGEARTTAAQRVQRAREQRDQKIAQVKADTEQRIQKIREQRDKTVDAVQAHYNELRGKERARIEARDAKEREHRKKMAENRKQQRELRELQQKTLRQLQWLSKNRNKAPEDLKAAFDDVLGDIDIYAVGAANEMNYSQKYGGTWKDIVAMYKHARDFDPNFLPSQDLERIMARLDNSKIEDLDIDALQDLYKAAVGLRTEFRNRNNVIGDEMHRIFEDVFEDVDGELSKAAGKFTGKKRDKFLNADQLNPMNYLQRMAGWNPDSTWYSMARQLEAGEREVRRYKVNASLRLQNFLKENQDWVARADGQGKDAVWYEMQVSPVVELRMGSEPILGEPVTVYMTPSQKIHLYLESKSPDNLRHMLGGRTFVDKELYSKGKRKEALAQGTTIRLAPQEVKRLVADMTDTELELAGLLESYYNQFAKQEINRVSNLLYGYDKAIGRNYAPIYTNQNYTQKEIGTYDATAEGVGNLKERVVSKNPSYNISAFDAFERHVDQTAKFVGMSVPIRNWNTLLNWRTSSTSMGDVITHKWGQEAKDYIDDTIKRLQSAQFDPKDTAAELADKLQSQYTRAVFGFNWGTVAKQLGGLSVAAADLGASNVPSPAHVKRVSNDLINTYTPELAYRGMGYATMETKHLKEHPGWTERSPFLKFTIGGGAITAMDQQVVKSMWAWAENKVRKEYTDLEIGTEQQVQNGDSPFYKKVAEVFEQALYNTQPMADEMHVSALRKSKNVAARAITMFRSDAMAAYNLMRKRVGEANYYTQTGQKQKARAAKRAVGYAMMGVMGNSLFGVLVNFVNNVLKYKGKKYKDEEEERMTGWSVGSEMGLDMLQSIAGNATAGGDMIADLIGNVITGEKWYGFDVPGIEQISEIAESVGNFLSGTGKTVADLAEVALKEDATFQEYWKRHWRDFSGAIESAADQILRLGLGIPASNIKTYLMGGVSWASPQAQAELEGLTANTTKSSLAGVESKAMEVKVRQLLEYRLGGDQSDAAEEIARLYESDAKSAKSAVPSDAPTEINDMKLTEGQMQVYDMAYRDIVNEAMEELMDSDSYVIADDEQKCKMLNALYDYADAMAREQVVPGSVEMKTATGQLSSFGKAAYLLESGVSLAEYIQLKSADAVDNAVKAVEAGEPVQRSTDVALMVSRAKAGLPEDATDLQKEAAVFDEVKTGQDEMTAAVMILDQDTIPKLEAAYSFGVTPETWTDFRERFERVYGKDENGRKVQVTKERAEDIIDEMMGLSDEERAILWQMQDRGWKWSSNPYDRKTAREFLEKAGWNE